MCSVFMFLPFYVYPFDASDFPSYTNELQRLEVSHIYMNRYGGWEW